MTNGLRAVLAAAVMGLFAVTNAAAEQIRLFEDRAALDQEIAKHMEEGSFSALVEALAPPSRISVGRIRILEEAFANDTPEFTKSATILQSGVSDVAQREVTAWWEGDVYLYIGMFTHARDDGVAVLDFAITRDIRRVSQWFHTGQQN